MTNEAKAARRAAKEAEAKAVQDRREARQARATEMVRLYAEELWTLQKIGIEYGCTRERVRQILKTQNVTFKDVHPLRPSQKKIRESRRAPRKCVVCGSCIPNNRQKFCRDECYFLLCAARFRLSAKRYDQHRRNVATSILRHAEAKSPAKVEWAKRMISDDPPPPNRRFVIKDSLVEQRYQEYLRKRWSRQ